MRESTLPATGNRNTVGAGIPKAGVGEHHTPRCGWSWLSCGPVQTLVSLRSPPRSLARRRSSRRDCRILPRQCPKCARRVLYSTRFRCPGRIRFPGNSSCHCLQESLAGRWFREFRDKTGLVAATDISPHGHIRSCRNGGKRVPLRLECAQQFMAAAVRRPDIAEASAPKRRRLASSKAAATTAAGSTRWPSESGAIRSNIAVTSRSSSVADAGTRRDCCPTTERAGHLNPTGRRG